MSTDFGLGRVTYFSQCNIKRRGRIRGCVCVPVIQLGLGAFVAYLQKTCPGNKGYKENGKTRRAGLNPSLSREPCAADPTQPQRNHKYLQTCKWEISGMLVMQRHGNSNWLKRLGKQLSLKCPLSRWNTWHTEKVRICPSSQPRARVNSALIHLLKKNSANLDTFHCLEAQLSKE